MVRETNTVFNAQGCSDILLHPPPMLGVDQRGYRILFIRVGSRDTYRQERGFGKWLTGHSKGRVPRAAMFNVSSRLDTCSSTGTSL